MSDAVIFAISLGVTVLGLVISWGVYRRRGAGTGLRGAALSLVPLAAAMTGVTEFFVDLAFSPVKWGGLIVGGLAVLLYLASGAMMSRRAAGAGGSGGRDETAGGGRRSTGRGAKPKGSVQGPAPGADPEMAEIERILRDRGIS